MNRKVIWIVNEYNFPDDDNSRQTNLCCKLNEKGYDAYVISGSAQNKGESNRIPDKARIKYVETSSSKGYIIKTSDYRNGIERVLVSIQFQFRIWKYRKKLPKPDVIVSDFAGLFGFIFFKWKKKYGTKIIYDILDLWPEAFVDMGYLKKDSIIVKCLYYLEHKTYANSDGIIFSFQGGRDYIIEKGWSIETGGDIDTSDIGYLNNGVNLALLEKNKNDYILEDEDLDSDKFKVIYLGSVSEFNGLDVLVETAKELQERGINNVIILIYGYGNQETKLKNLAESYNLDNIVFKGKVDKKYAMNLLTRGDLNIFTFKNNPILKYGVSPNKLFVYFASGKPVLSMIKPNYDLVEEKKAGISVENNPKIVANAIEEFCKMEQEKYRMYCKNSKKTAKEYDYSILVNELIKKIEGAE